MLRKLNKQQRLLLEELERTKRRLREEIRAREEGTTPQHDDDSDQNNSAAPPFSNPPKFELAAAKDEAAQSKLSGCKGSATWSPTGRAKNERLLTISAVGHNGPARERRRGAEDGAVNGLKRSRSEAGIGISSDNDAVAAGGEVGGKQGQRKGNNEPPTAATRIDMLPVMASTG